MTPGKLLDSPLNTRPRLTIIIAAEDRSREQQASCADIDGNSCLIMFSVNVDEIRAEVKRMHHAIPLLVSLWMRDHPIPEWPQVVEVGSYVASQPMA